MDAERFLRAFTRWAESRDDVHAVLLVGSRGRTDAPADEWSDVDLALVIEEPDRYLGDERWIEAFGHPLLTFLEPIAVGRAVERRVLYAGGLDVDIAIFTPDWLEQAVEDPQTASVIRRGHRVLVDKLGLGDLAERAASVAIARRLPDESEFRELAADFWYHALWAARKLARGELLMAKRSVDGYLKERLLTLFAWHAQAGDPQLDTWHEGRFFERWADPRAVEALRGSFAHYDPDEVRNALFATMNAFEWCERETAERLGFSDPPRRDPVRTLVQAVLARD